MTCKWSTWRHRSTLSPLACLCLTVNVHLLSLPHILLPLVNSSLHHHPVTHHQHHHQHRHRHHHAIHAQTHPHPPPHTISLPLQQAARVSSLPRIIQLPPTASIPLHFLSHLSPASASASSPSLCLSLWFTYILTHAHSQLCYQAYDSHFFPSRQSTPFHFLDAKKDQRVTSPSMNGTLWHLEKTDILS